MGSVTGSGADRHPNPERQMIKEKIINEKRNIAA
jgi:hypothetical protein